MGDEIRGGLIDSLISPWKKEAETLSGHFAKVWSGKFLEGLRARGKEYGKLHGAKADCYFVSAGLSAMQDEMEAASKPQAQKCSRVGSERQKVAMELLRVARELLV